MRRIEPIRGCNAFDADGYERESILRAESRNRRDGTPMTKERAIESGKEIDPSFKVDLGSTNIPAFLYNSKGNITH